MSRPGARVLATFFLMPKDGASVEECEDAVGVNVEALRFAVADGATEAFDSGSWARLLVEAWVGADGAAKPSAEEFRARVVERGRRLHESWAARGLPWYAEEKARMGSFATFAGLAFGEREGGLDWRAVALGDACVVQLRGGAILSALPLSNHGEFNSCPPLVPSNAAAAEAALARAVEAGGAAEGGDQFLLLSDAVAAWFFQSFEGHGALAEKFDSLLSATDNVALAELFRGERAAGRIKDDDVAIVRVTVAGGV